MNDVVRTTPLLCFVREDSTEDSSEVMFDNEGKLCWDRFTNAIATVDRT